MNVNGFIVLTSAVYFYFHKWSWKQSMLLGHGLLLRISKRRYIPIALLYLRNRLTRSGFHHDFIDDVAFEDGKREYKWGKVRVEPLHEFFPDVKADMIHCETGDDEWHVFVDVYEHFATADMPNRFSEPHGCFHPINWDKQLKRQEMSK